MTPEKVLDIWREAKKQVDGLKRYHRESLYDNGVVALCKAHAEEVIGANIEAGASGLNPPWQSALDEMNGEKR